MEFNDYEWHDAILKDLNIDRNNPWYNDTISLKIEWADKTISTMVFDTVYQALIELDYEAIGGNNIREVYIAPNNDKDLIMVKSMWKDYKIENLNCYIFETVKYNSIIKIIATGFQIKTK